MAKNLIFDELTLNVICTHPTTPLSGQPVRVGNLTGVALENEDSDGTCVVDFREMVYDLKAKGVDDAGNSAIVKGDKLYYVDADINDGTGFLSKKASGYFYGYALEAVNAGATDTINVLCIAAPGQGTLDIPDGSIATAKLADAAVTAAKLAAAVAGDGLTGGAGSALAVNPDGTTLEINADAVRVKDAGISAAKLATDAVETLKIKDLNVTTGKLAASGVTFAKAAVFISTEQTGTGNPQNVAHGLAAVPAGVLVVPTEHPGAPDTGAFDIAEGAHDGTNVVVTVTANVKFKVMAWA